MPSKYFGYLDFSFSIVDLVRFCHLCSASNHLKNRRKSMKSMSWWIIKYRDEK